MSLVKAIGESNAPKADGDTDKTSGSVGMVGFTPVDYPGQRPAKSNADLFTNDVAPGLGQDGTNLSAYDEQEAEVNPKTGK